VLSRAWSDGLCFGYSGFLSGPHGQALQLLGFVHQKYTEGVSKLRRGHFCLQSFKFSSAPEEAVIFRIFCIILQYLLYEPVSLIQSFSAIFSLVSTSSQHLQILLVFCYLRSLAVVLTSLQAAFHFFCTCPEKFRSDSKISWVIREAGRGTARKYIKSCRMSSL